MRARGDTLHFVNTTVVRYQADASMHRTECGRYADTTDTPLVFGAVELWECFEIRKCKVCDRAVARMKGKI